MYTLSVITEISPDQFLPHVSSLTVLFSNMLNSVQDLSSPLAYYTVLTMIHFVPLVEGDQSVSCISCTICKVHGVHKWTSVDPMMLSVDEHSDENIHR